MPHQAVLRSAPIHAEDARAHPVTRVHVPVLPGTAACSEAGAVSAMTVPERAKAILLNLPWPEKLGGAPKRPRTSTIIGTVRFRSILLSLFLICFILIPMPFVLRYSGIFFAYRSQDNVSFDATTPDDVVMADSFENIVWFLQSTDIHYKESSPHRHYNYRRFLERARDEWRPAFILNTGDTTDAIVSFPFVRGQLDSEWDSYVTDLEETGWGSPLRHIDVLGNHDAMNSGSPRSASSLFYERTPTGRAHFADETLTESVRGDQTVTLTVERRGDLLRFEFPMPLDNLTVLLMNLPQTDPGLTIPANFYGNLNAEQTMAIDESFPTDGMVITAGHQCARWTQMQTFDTRSFDGLMSRPNNALNLCGHIHSLGYSRFGSHHTPEIASSSFTRRRFQAVVVDHGLVSVHEHTLDTPALLLPSNPPQGHIVSAASPVHRVGQSTHIRALFTGDCPATATATIGDKTYPLFCTPIPEDYEYALPGTSSVNLLTAEWNPAELGDGLHRITFNVVANANGDTMSNSYEFSLDGTATPLDRVRWSIGLDHPSNTTNMFTHWTLFWAAVLITVLASVALTALLPIRLKLTTVRNEAGSHVEARWVRHPILIILAAVLIFAPNYVIKANREDWALVFSFCVVERGRVVFDTFFYLIPLIVTIVTVLPGTGLLAFISAYKGFRTHIHHVRRLNMGQLERGLLGLGSKGLPVQLIVDLGFAAVVLAVLTGIVLFMGVLYVLGALMWAPDVLSGLVTLVFSPALLLSHVLLLGAIVWEAMGVARLRLMPLTQV
ncbi:transmembrane protein 62-like [Carpediemonas membranifera]|uniref:Transmembrane protein 62-like n=1 Tax=Carpediemonas membranifera TaxID=201153 RepID=A0A8J6C0H0_9EUKA|nr:transmembrane protein 62-like [Carpediemonas membranifera]|eukprot:KAG9396576.1 transmembrane protein 62-like [Carpediemonas membranifera]